MATNYQNTDNETLKGKLRNIRRRKNVCKKHDADYENMTKQ